MGKDYGQNSKTFKFGRYLLAHGKPDFFFADVQKERSKKDQRKQISLANRIGDANLHLYNQPKRHNLCLTGGIGPPNKGLRAQ